MTKALLTLLAFLHVAPASAVVANIPESEAIGTYELLICKSECSFQNPAMAIARGTIVIFKDALSPEDIERIDRFHHARTEEVLRACFYGVRSEHTDTYAFIQKTGATMWSFENNSLKLGLFRSPDAGYEVDLQLRGNALSGEGHSWGAGAGAPRFSPVDVIVGRRVGPPRISACLPAT